MVLGEFLMVVPPEFTELEVTPQVLGAMEGIQGHINAREWPELGFLLVEALAIEEGLTVTNGRVFGDGFDYRLWVVFG